MHIYQFVVDGREESAEKLDDVNGDYLLESKLAGGVP